MRSYSTVTTVVGTYWSVTTAVGSCWLAESCIVPSPPGEISVEVELLLELEGLVAGVGRSLPFRLPVLIDSI